MFIVFMCHYVTFKSHVLSFFC